MIRKTVLALLVLLLATAATARTPLNQRYSDRNAATNVDLSTYIDANQILMFVTNEGSFGYDKGGLLGKNDGLYFPYTGVENILNGTNRTSVIFASGIWLGGINNDSLSSSYGDTLISVAEYSDDFWAGPMIGGTFDPGAATNPSYRVYKLYADSMEDNPNQDYLDWPVADGAPVDSAGKPALSGDQMCWAVYNDANPAPHTNDASSATGLGVEIRQTTFAFNREGALANIVFVKFQIFNKGGIDIKDMFVSLWADPDLGDAGDDFVGSDTVLSLGYCYNDGDDADYGSTPPAVGYDFFQGPLILTGDTNDVAKMWDTTFVGYKNMPMTSFNKYINGTDPQSAFHSYNYMNGLTRDGLPLTDPNTGDTTKYFGAGDPVAGTGWLDNNSSDRRYMLTTGPFDFPSGDSTEIVAAIIVARGSNRLASITDMKKIDLFAQQVYDSNFVLPSPPAKPDVDVTNLDGTVLLTWGTNSEDNPGDYQFEGYAVFQGGSQSGPWDTLAWYDIDNGVQGIIDFRFEPTIGGNIAYVAKPGTDAGLRHYYRTTIDKVGGGLLQNYTEYFYRIEAYSFDTTTAPGQRTLTSASVVKAMPQPPLVGTDLNTKFGDTLTWTHTAGASDGSVTIEVIDPTKLTGDAYKVTFADDTTLGTVWYLINTSTGDTVLANQTNQSADNAYPVADGMLVKVSGPPLEGKDWQYESASPLNVSPVAAADNGYAGGDRWFTGGSHGGELLFGGVFMEPNFWGATTVGPADMKTVEIRWRPMQSYTDLNGDGSYTIGEPYTVDSASLTQSAFMYTTFSGSAYEGFFPVPFTAWDVSNPSSPRQLNVVVRDRDQDSSWNLHAQTGDPALPNNGDQRYNYTWILNSTYDPTGTMYGDGSGGTIDFWGAPGGAVYDAMWVLWLDERGTSRGQLAEACTLRLIPNLVNSPADEYTFTTANFEPSVAQSGSQQLLDKIKAVPNPYYLFSNYDANKSSRFLKFTNLPAKCTITIYTLNGDLVAQIDKDNAGTTEALWDVQNRVGIPVASGIYIYVVDAPGFGQKIGKMAVFTEVELLDQY